MNNLPNPRRRIAPLAFVLLAILASAGLVNAQNKSAADAPAQPENPTFVVSGRVVYENTDRPVRRAQIALIQLPGRRASAEHSSATDREGRFAIGGVPAGVYFAFVNSPGIIAPYAFTTLTDRGPSESFDVKAIREYCTEVVVEGSDIEVTVRARRGGAISGKVTYADGDPAVNVEIAIVRQASKQLHRVLTGLNATALLSLHPDDRGRYRISGVPPGEYVVYASEKNTAPQNQSRRGYGFEGIFGSGDALVVTYYGSTPDVNDALKLQVEANSELTGIDITLPDMTPHTIRGTIIAKLDRIPLPDATVSIRMKQQMDWFGQEARQFRTDDQGQWFAYDIPDGSYVLRVEPPTNILVPGATPTPTPSSPADYGRPPQPTRKFVPTEAQVTVAGGDVLLEPIALPEGASVSGTLELPAELKDTPGVFLQIGWRYEGEPDAGYQNSTSTSNESFTIEGLREGKIHLNATFSPYGLGLEEKSKYFIKAITLNGQDLTTKPIALKEGQTVSGVRIVIASGSANASVKLVSAENKPVSSRRLAIVSVEESRWLFLNEMINGTTDSQGTMSFSCPPGEYFVLVSAAESVWPPTYELIRQRSADAPRIKVSAGENKTFVITVSSTGSPSANEN